MQNATKRDRTERNETERLIEGNGTERLLKTANALNDNFRFSKRNCTFLETLYVGPEATCCCHLLLPWQW